MSGYGAMGSARGGMRLWLACATLLGALLIVVTLWSPTAAQAALTHEWLGNIAGKNGFSKEASPKKGFSPEVCGVSVDPASGEIFVSDPEAGSAETAQVEVFDKSGAPLAGRSILKAQIAEEETAEEVAEREANEKADREKGKTPKEVAGKFSEREELEEFCSTAENDKNGHLYIADGGLHAIIPFDKEGKQVFATNKEGKKIAGAEITGKATPTGELGEELNIAIDQNTGRLYVADRENEAVDIFSEAGTYEGQLPFPGSAESEHLPGPLAVDQKTGEVYVSVQGQAQDEEEDEEAGFIYVYDSSGRFLREISGRRSGSFVGFGKESEPLLTGLAVGPEGDVYVSDAKRRTVFELEPSGSFVGEISGTPSAPFSEPFGVAVSAVGSVYVVDHTEELNGGRVEPLPGLVDIFGANAIGTPTIESETVSDVTATSVTLRANIDPTGVETSYHFEFCQDSSCADVPALPGTDIGKGEATVAVSQPIEGLTANTVYTYRVFANSVAGAVQSFTTKIEGATINCRLVVPLAPAASVTVRLTR
jgi:DNA-binding beta-propeller fold protein YncE